MRRAAELGAMALAWVATGAFFLAFFGASVVSRDACVSRHTGAVHHEEWELDPLAWFGATTINGAETCEPETASQYAVGKVPVFGESFEKSMGGPANPDYYENN